MMIPVMLRTANGGDRSVWCILVWGARTEQNLCAGPLRARVFLCVSSLPGCAWLTWPVWYVPAGRVVAVPARTPAPSVRLEAPVTEIRGEAEWSRVRGGGGAGLPWRALTCILARNPHRRGWRWVPIAWGGWRRRWWCCSRRPGSPTIHSGLGFYYSYDIMSERLV